MNGSKHTKLRASIHFNENDGLEGPSDETLEYVATQIYLAAFNAGVHDTIGGWSVLPVVFTDDEKFQIGGITVVLPYVKLASQVDFRGWPFLVEGVSIDWGSQGRSNVAAEFHEAMSLGLSIGLEKSADDQDYSGSFGGFLQSGSEILGETCGHVGIGIGGVQHNSRIWKEGDDPIWLGQPSNQDVKRSEEDLEKQIDTYEQLLATRIKIVKRYERAYPQDIEDSDNGKYEKYLKNRDEIVDLLEKRKGLLENLRELTKEKRRFGKLLIAETKVVRYTKDFKAPNKADFFNGEMWVYDQAQFDIGQYGTEITRKLRAAIMRADHITLDYALIAIEPNRKGNNRVGPMESPITRVIGVEELNLGDQIGKFGRSTGITKGTVGSRRIYACLQGNMLAGADGVMRRVVTTEYCVQGEAGLPFSKAGDSGSWCYHRGVAKAKIMAGTPRTTLIDFSIISPLLPNLQEAAKAIGLEELEILV